MNESGEGFGGGLLNKKELVESKLKISITRQSELLGIARSGLYYVPIMNKEEIAIKK